MARRRLKTLADSRRLVSWTINQVISDEMDLKKAGKLGYLANILKSIIQDGELEERIKALEAKIK